MSEALDLALPATLPGADEAEIAREDAVLLTRELLLTAAPDMAVVRISGSDKAKNAVRVGLSPEAAMRIGAAFIRAALRIKPSLRAQVVEGGSDAELRAIAGEGAARG